MHSYQAHCDLRVISLATLIKEDTFRDNKHTGQNICLAITYIYIA